MANEIEAGDGLRGVWRELDILVGDVRRARAAVAAAQAREAALLARAVDLIEARTGERRAAGLRFGNDLPLREVSAELGTAMRVGDRTVQRRIGDAHTLVTRFAATCEAWRAGRIDRQHVTTIVDEKVAIADELVRREYESLVLAVAEVESAGRLREIARVIAARVDSGASALRRKAAMRSRDVRVIDLDDGMGRLLADLPAPLAHAIRDRIDEFARRVSDAEKRDESQAPLASDPVHTGGDIGADEESEWACRRTLGEIRADVLADLLLTSVPEAHRDSERQRARGRARADQPHDPYCNCCGAGRRARSDERLRPGRHGARSEDSGGGPRLAPRADEPRDRCAGRGLPLSPVCRTSPIHRHTRRAVSFPGMPHEAFALRRRPHDRSRRRRWNQPLQPRRLLPAAPCAEALLSVARRAGRRGPPRMDESDGTRVLGLCSRNVDLRCGTGAGMGGGKGDGDGDGDGDGRP
ncbi:DUF222 domain-containing protein [Microbacterium sp. BK668]|uniref:DUF222 domain-containing protein n=1 Tax=Microbacterium sp. BK668 TaxID=2512118 RepID=UPI0014151E11|nr:DUF222 domain-containing protein [Microbacterium sp. BK668]